MSLSNKNVLISIALLLGIALSGAVAHWVLPSFVLGAQVFYYGFGAAQLAGIMLLVANSDFQQTIYPKLILTVLPFIAIGAWLKIIHMPGANLLLCASIFSIIGIYTVRFLNKKHKNRLDVLKLLWVITAFSITILILLHRAPWPVSRLRSTFLWLALLDFAWHERKRNKADID